MSQSQNEYSLLLNDERKKIIYKFVDNLYLQILQNELPDDLTPQYVLYDLLMLKNLEQPEVARNQFENPSPSYISSKLTRQLGLNIKDLTIESKLEISFEIKRVYDQVASKKLATVSEITGLPPNFWQPAPIKWSEN